jgi:hypothetical protein
MDAANAPVPIAGRKPTRAFVIAMIVMTPMVLALFIFFMPPAVDWYRTFAEVATSPFQPYQVPSYINPPWVALFLAPLGLLPVRVSQAVNAYLNILFLMLVLHRYQGDRFAYLLGFTSYPFMGLIANGTVEWVAMAGFWLQGAWGTFLLAAKPQIGIFAALIWFKEGTNKKQFLLILSALLIVSLLLWGFWPVDLLHNIQTIQSSGMENWNFSLWPWGIPVGILLLYQAWKRSDDLLAVAATFCVIPYFTLHSLAAGFTILAARNLRLGVLVWILLWLYPVVMTFV